LPPPRSLACAKSTVAICMQHGRGRYTVCPLSLDCVLPRAKALFVPLDTYPQSTAASGTLGDQAQVDHMSGWKQNKWSTCSE
jgi:hypothetical protein